MDDPDTKLSKNEEFDQAYRLPITFWGDIRIPGELKSLIKELKPSTAIELGCGLGRTTRFMARLGIKATGIDFSKVAIEKARKRASLDKSPPSYVVGDVTRLETMKGPFDISLDIGCFHCLDVNEQRLYVSGLSKIIKPGGTHLLWVMDTTPPPDQHQLTPEMVEKVFATGFKLRKSESSRRRIVKSHWYWFIRS